VLTTAEQRVCDQLITACERPSCISNAPTTCPITHVRWEYLIEVQRAAAVGPSSGEIASCMCLHCGRMRCMLYKCIAHSSTTTPAVRMDNCCTADSATTNNVSAAKQRRARVQRCDLVLMKNDDECLCWEAKPPSAP